MKRIDPHTELQIKEAADIVAVVGSFVDLKRSGKDWMGLCPFHEDRHIGSFVVSPAKNVCSCFSCGWKGGPVDFLMKHENLKYGEALRWLAGKFNIYVEDQPERFRNIKPAPKREAAPDLPLVTFPMDMVRGKLVQKSEVKCNVVEWMRSLPWDEDQRRMLENYLGLYAVGVSDRGKTKGWAMWWYIDEQMRPRTAKLMAYKPDGHRDKLLNPYTTREGITKYYNFDFVHAMTSRKRCEPRGQRWLWDDKELKSEGCLFGLHLMNAFPDAEVCIVESEKTAIIAQMFVPVGKKVFMATASKGNLTRRLLQPLIDAGRWIILYPDVDGMEEWQGIADQMDYERIKVTDNVQRLYKPGKDDPKSDIADILVRMLVEQAEHGCGTASPEHEEVNECEAVVRMLKAEGECAEAVRMLIERLELELVSVKYEG